MPFIAWVRDVAGRAAREPERPELVWVPLRTPPAGCFGRIRRRWTRLASKARASQESRNASAARPKQRRVRTGCEHALGVDPDQQITTKDSKLDAAHLVGALAGLLGLTGYVYVLGGLALYVELFRTGIPAGEAIDEFTSRRYLVVGLPIALIVGVVFLVVVLAVKFISGHARGGLDKLGEKLKSRSLTKWFAKPGAKFVASLRGHWPTQPVRVLLAIGLVLMVLCMVAVAFVWPPITLRQASVTTQNGECITGAYISTDGNGVNLADGRARRLWTVPTAKVVAVVIGQKLPLSDQSITVTRAPCA
jgi:hypothetical protein